MTDSPRRVAILGGNRIPFARSNSAYSHASNQDMLTAWFASPASSGVNGNIVRVCGQSLLGA